ncbi:hypothetical protein [Thermoleptolyngbya sp. M55_K2018_002]|uniref:hypothetical protein n=1 Tax=Thermoleptolyngbya sp. M55_K2018_002 TaxID=2747808 RepID=UPI0019F61AEB|nr:hypothetical protein [Thermoleptolyngbya sp. M55_K2018_002]HIK40391.1 hypothetical protein [Thermoleptolyngbya sp. M55_K2018_002]
MSLYTGSAGRLAGRLSGLYDPTLQGFRWRILDFDFRFRLKPDGSYSTQNPKSKIQNSKIPNP